MHALITFFRKALIVSCKIITGVQAHSFTYPEGKVRVYYANHTSHLDGIVIWSSLPKAIQATTHPVAAKDYWGKSRWKRFISISVFNSVLIDRKIKVHGENPIDEMVKQLDNQQSLIIFPEGSRGEGDHINDFKGGIYHLASKNKDIEFVPVYLNNLNRVLPKGSMLLVPIICSVTFGKPIESLKENETKIEFLQRAKSALKELIV